MNLGIKIIIVGVIFLSISIVVTVATIETIPSEQLMPEELPEGVVPIQPQVGKTQAIPTYSVYAGFAIIIAGIVVKRIRK